MTSVVGTVEARISFRGSGPSFAPFGRAKLGPEGRAECCDPLACPTTKVVGYAISRSELETKSISFDIVEKAFEVLRRHRRSAQTTRR